MFLTVCNNTDLTKFVEHWFTSLTTHERKMYCKRQKAGRGLGTRLLVYIRIIPSSFVAKFIKANNEKLIQNSTEYGSRVYHLWESIYVDTYIIMY